MDQLPIDAVLDELRAALGDRGGAVLQAPPGAGKTTRVPIALLDEPWLAGGRVLMLEPRRLAARAAAAFMARSLDEPVGERVGFRVRGESRVGPHTRIEVVTEGVLTRMLQRDPLLGGAGIVIFDEFHERSVHADLGLALTLQVRALLRPELRVLVMSATLETAAVAALLGDAPAIASSGRAYPVEVRYLARPVERVDLAVAATVRRVLREEEGDVLVFLPGAAEIHRLHETLRGDVAADVDLYPLHGTLPGDVQDRAIRASPTGRRKVVIATSIAETSLTIDGVRTVIDSGLMRVPRFSPRTGMTRLETVRVTRASAAQRAGRAGRTAPGICYRLWAEAEHAALLDRGAPEILTTDLAPLALELAAWGVRDPAQLAWLDPPPAAGYAQARELLRELDALDGADVITDHGRALVDLPLHPRLAHMLLGARALGALPLACTLAALLDERDLLRRGDGPPDPDLRLRIDALHRGSGADRGTLERVRRHAEQLARRFGVRAIGFDGEAYDPDMVGLLLALAYPDRIAQRRAGSPDRVLLRNGRGAVLAAAGALATAEFMVAAQLEDRGRESRVFIAAPLERGLIEQHFAAAIDREDVVAWDDEAQAVRARTRRRLGALVLEERTLADPDPEAVRGAVAGAIRRLGLEALAWSPESAQLRERIAFLHRLDPGGWPDVGDGALLADLEHWLLAPPRRVRSLDELRRIDPGNALGTLLDGRQRRALDELAPTHWQVPSGSRIAIDYADDAAPVLAVRLQELFGASETPRIARGRVPLTLHLLSPAQRPVQVTRDLASFWRDAYFEVRKDLKGRYPKHYWPDDPLAAEPTRRARPRGRRGES
jgi:ATP-dependent helicase HrpB